MKKLRQAITIIVGLALGFAGGVVLGKNLHSLSPLQAFYCLLWLFVAYFASIIIHEGGHYVMGKLTGYTFVSFRIGSTIWVKQDDKLVRRKFNIAGTGGQCLLMPPKTDEPEKAPFFLYNFGGGLFNLITAAICLPAGILLENFWIKAPFLIFGILGIVLGLLNLIPVSTTVNNDGMNILRMSKDKSLRTAFYNAMAVNGLQSEGAMLSEIPERYFTLPADASKNAEDMILLLKAQRLEENFNFAAANEMYSKFIEEDSKIQLYVNEAKCERLFCRMADGADKSEIESLYDKPLKTYIKQTEKMFVTRRKLLYLYNLIYKEDKQAAEKEYQKAVDMKNTYPNLGEYKTEMQLIDYVKNKYA